MGDVVVHGKVALEVGIDETRESEMRRQQSAKARRKFSHIKHSLCASLDSTESTSLPLATSHELERTSGDLLAGGSNTDDGRNTPSYPQE